ncbi:helix-turn-helix domain-containing protein [Inquilinus sp. Marseille-Q2685]|uniref:MarR family transcriptional regulator n=1 Tax=Inquilinus sp. Marseille-Q2685 TaxID=2866581 RepID=UPI001CE40F2B|nr:helix-turn-helix domain-containing protein [Inquilinus sp. Marseille-Q2685]
MGEQQDSTAGMTAKGRLKLAILYGTRPRDLDLVRGEIRPLADLFELPIAGDHMPQIRSLEPDLVLVHLGSLPRPVDVAFARRILGPLRGARKLVVVGDRDLMTASDLAFDLIGHVVYDEGLGDAAIRMLIRRNLAFLAGFRRKIGRIDSTLDRMADLSQDIVAQHAEMLSLHHDGPAGPGHAGGGGPAMTDSPVALIDASLAIIKSLAGALGDEFVSVEYVQILMFLQRSRLAGRRGVSVSELCGLIDAPYSTTVRRIDELAKKSYLRKSVDPIDKRRINVEIAGPSVAIVERFLGGFKASIGGLLGGSDGSP